MKKINLTIIGGGSTYTPGIIKSLIEEKDRYVINDLILYDNDANRQEIIGRGLEVVLREHYPELNSFKYTTCKQEAFENADFFFIQIRTGGLMMRHLDEKIPLSHNCVGQETCGAGGVFYGLRSIPDMIELVNDIRKYSNGWILNYTNPAAIVAIALKKEFPNDERILNVCDMPAVILNSYATLMDCEIWDLVPNYFGLNHHGWFTDIYHKNGELLTDKIKEKILKDGICISERDLGEDPSWKKTFDQVRYTLSDFGEYLPNTYLQYYLYPSKMVKKEDINNTRAQQVINSREINEFSAMKEIFEKQTSGALPNEVDIHGQYMIRLAESIAYNKNERYIIITQNNGIIENLDNDVMVEVPAILNSSGIHPLAIGKIDRFYKGLIEVQNACEQLTVEAFYEKSYDKLLQALTLNRTVTDADVAKKVLDDLLVANKDYVDIKK